MNTTMPTNIQNDLPQLPGVCGPNMAASKRQRSHMIRTESSKKRRHFGECSHSIDRATSSQIVNALECSGACAFLQKTYMMISTSDPDLASWSTDGRSIIVKNKNRFEKEEIPKYFDHDKFASFSRQLNFYGFKKSTNKSSLSRVRNKNGQIVFQNKLFIRGRIDLLEKIKRTTNNAHKVKTQIVEERNEVNVLKERIATLETDNSSIEKDLVQMRKDLAALQRQVDGILHGQKRKHDPCLSPLETVRGNCDWMPTIPIRQKSLEIDLKDINLPPPPHSAESSRVRSISSSFLELMLGRSLTQKDAATINAFNDCETHVHQ